MKKAKKEGDKNPFVSIAAAIGGISVAIVAIVMLFSPNQAWVLAPVISSLALMGVILGFFAYRK